MKCSIKRPVTVTAGLLVLTLQLAACEDDEPSATADASTQSHGDDEEHARGGHGGNGGNGGSGGAGGKSGSGGASQKDAGGVTSDNKAPSAYPDDWEVELVAGQPLPDGYAFGHEKSVFKKGETFGMQKLALPCDVAFERDVPVKLRDGKIIYVDLLSPTDNEDNKRKLPAIMAWSPYGKTLPTAGPTSVPPERFSGIGKFEGPDAAFWVCRDYVIVDVDTRGAYKSEGDLQVFGEVDAGDGYDVVEWVAQQSWSNGAVGMHGASWLSMAQWNIAATNPPHLKAISPWNGQSDLYRNSICQGGIPDTAFSGMVGARLVSQNKVESSTKMLEKEPFLSAYWQGKRPKVEAIEAAAYVGADIATGLHTAGTLDAFRRLGSKDKWLRVNNTNEWYDQYTQENEEDLLKFFDHFLKGVSNDWNETPRVRVAVMDPGKGGGDKVNTPFDSWPLPDTEYRKLYLDNGALKNAAPADAAKVSYAADSGETTFTLTWEEDTQIVGYPLARLFVEADGNDDADVFVLIEKLDSDDSLLVPSELAAMYFPKPAPGAPGRLRASMRELDKNLSTEYLPVHAFQSAKKLGGGEVAELDIAIQPTALRWHKGQKLRLTIAGTFVRGGGLPLTTLNKGTHIVHTGGEHASYLQIPVVKWTP
jgi:predicted acyl esterase